MKVVKDLSIFNESVLLVKLTPDESNETSDEADFDFTWTVTDFSEKQMTIQVEWANIYMISQGTSRDLISVTVLQNENFVSSAA